MRFGGGGREAGGRRRRAALRTHPSAKCHWRSSIRESLARCEKGIGPVKNGVESGAV